MAAKKNSSVKKKVEWKGYHTCNLWTDDELPFEAWAGSQVITIDDLDVLAQKGYKFSLSWDEYHSGITAGLYAADSKLDWAGYSLTAWAGSAEDAIKLLFYKHYIMCKEQWEIAPNNAEKMSRKYG